MRNIELLVPASSLEVLKVAVIFGADAVYIGGEVYGLRAKAKNFSKEDMAEGIAFAHAHGVKVYVTANILAHNGDLPGVRRYFEELKKLKPMHSSLRIRRSLRSRARSARRSMSISARRRTIPIMALTISGMDLARPVWYQRGSYF